MSARQEIISTGKMVGGIVAVDLATSNLERLSQPTQEDLIRSGIVGLMGAVIFLKAFIEMTNRPAGKNVNSSAYSLMHAEDIVTLSTYREKRKEEKAIAFEQKMRRTG